MIDINKEYILCAAVLRKEPRKTFNNTLPYKIENNDILKIEIGYRHHDIWQRFRNEIEKWLQENFGGMGTKFGEDYEGTPYYRKHYHEEDVDYEYVIFDDNTDFLLGQSSNFIHINEQTGLTDEDVEKARKILMREI